MMRVWVLLAFLLWPLWLNAQQIPRTEIYYIQPVLVMERSDIGKEIIARYQSETLAANELNQKVTAELDAEEARLTKERSSLSFEEFQPLAEAFDKKSEYERARFSALGEALEIKNDAWNERLFGRLRDELDQIEAQRPSIIIIDSRYVLTASRHLDLGPLVIERLNEDYARNKEAIDAIIFAEVEEATRLTKPYLQSHNEDQ